MATNTKNDSPPPILLRAVDDGPARALATSEVKVTRVARRVRVGTARDAAAGLVALPPDAVVRVEHENGLVQWIRADDLLHERGRRAVARGDGTEAWDIDPLPRIGSGDAEGVERGALGIGIKVLEFFGVEVAKGTAALIGKTFERRRLGRDPGLYRVTLAAEPAFEPIADGRKVLKAGRPTLVFLHGTMSSFAGSFKDLGAVGDDEAGRAAAALRAQCDARYRGEVYAWEHRTLSQSPIANALELVRDHLPDGAQLHLVSHSRGGLVGELLGLGQRDTVDDPLRAELLDRLFAEDRTPAEQLGLARLGGDEGKARDEGYARDRRDLAELIALLDRKAIRVTRFVRVACPARGTTLASGRLDRWLSMLDFVVPGGLFGDVLDFLLAVVKERTDPRTMPGIEAMMPGSALTRLLHLPTLVTGADLSAIAGDLEGRGPLGRLKLLALDWFYGSAHDLVVNTGSMTGGIARRPGAARFRRDEGERTTHFAYFRNKVSIDWLAAALAREEGSDAGFLPIAAAPVEEPRARAAMRASRASATPRPLAIVVPGTMGSALSVRDRRVWLAYWALVKGGLGDIGIDADDVTPVDLLDDFYGPLIEHLARTHQVDICPYDWRRSVREAATLLTAKVEAALAIAERTRQPVHIVAHSMGGLVARAMIADRGPGAQAWARMKALPGSRLLMLGTPNRGSHEAVRWLTGFNPTQAKLILLDFTRGTNGVIDVVRRFPGVAELLPWHEEPNPWAQVSTWRALKKELGAGWTPIEDAVLRQAQATWKLLADAAVEPAHMVYVAGCQPATVVDHDVVVEQFGFARKALRWIATAEGDGTVPWSSGRLPGVPMYYAPDTGHDQLCSNEDDRRIFRGYVDLLLTGRTDQLPSSPPGLRRAAGGPAERFVLPEQPPLDDLPDEAAVRSLGFGGTRAPRRRAGARGALGGLRVRVRHADLRYARFPVLLGHYQGDTIVGTEEVLDRQLGGRGGVGPLQRRREMGLYPGERGTSAVFFNDLPGRSPAGGIVVGLGLYGELSPNRLEASIRDALLEYASRSLERASAGAPRASGTPRVAANVSCLLVGSSGDPTIRVRDSVEAILRAALAANRRLEEVKLDDAVLIDEVELVEVYEDIAMLAAYELGQLLDSGGEWARVRWTERIVTTGRGGRSGRGFEGNGAWWQRIDIAEDRRADRLKFVVTGNRARAEETLAAGQLALADNFIARACASPNATPDLSKTLFEMLLPLRLKESAPDQRDTLVLVDEFSARFPWELLEDRWSRIGRPFAVSTGVVRQLRTPRFRTHPTYAVGNTAFIVGNPHLNGWHGFADLPGARDEARRVGEVLRKDGFDTTEAIDADAASILDGLHARPWRVLHLAGHGEHGFDLAGAPLADAPPLELSDGSFAKRIVQPRRVSGMVVGEGAFLTPGDVEQMRYVPELVFVNCCHLGKTTPASADFNRLAANLGVQFIEMGVRAVVCAGWAVDDRAATIFADAFYTSLLRGDTFIVAVQQARQATHDANPGVNTWGAYQCYGDPAYRLVRSGRARSGSWANYVSPSELVRDLNELRESLRLVRQEAGDDDRSPQRWLQAQVDDLLNHVPAVARSESGWLGRADVCAALGFAYGEAWLFAEAVEWLNRALNGTVGDCPVRAAEQCANFIVRLAADEWAALRVEAEAGDLDDPKVQVQRARIAEKIGEALYELDVINTRASTRERLALLGSACKRLAWVERGRGRVEALLNMASYYRQALDKAPSQLDAYTFGNWAVACLLLERIDPQTYGRGAWHPALAEACTRHAAKLRRDDEDNPDLWSGTGLADLMLVDLLMQPGDRARCDRLGKAASAQYAAAFARGASLREVASIRDHLEFLTALTGDAEAPWPAAARDALAQVHRSL